MKKDTWREVPGTGGMYKIEKGTWRCWSEYVQRFLSNKPDKWHGRIYWSLKIDGKWVNRQAAVWIALTFPELVQGGYFEGAEIDHLDTNRLNNDPSNLRWTTPKGNSNNPLTRIHKSEAQINHPADSKPVIQYDLDWNFIARYPSAREAERQTGVNQSNISLCCHGKRKAPGGFYWRYEIREAS